MNWNIAGFKRDKQGLMSNSPNAGIYYSEETFDLYSKAEEMANLLERWIATVSPNTNWGKGVQLETQNLLDSMREEERKRVFELYPESTSDEVVRPKEFKTILHVINQLLKDVEALRGKS